MMTPAGLILVAFLMVFLLEASDDWHGGPPAT